MTLNVRFLYERNLLIFIILAVDRKISGIFNRPITRCGSQVRALVRPPNFLISF